MKLVGAVGSVLLTTLVGPWLYGRREPEPRLFVIENVSKSPHGIEVEEAEEVIGDSVALLPLRPPPLDDGHRYGETCERNSLMWQFLFSFLNTVLCHLLFWFFTQKRRADRREREESTSIEDEGQVPQTAQIQPETRTRANGRPGEGRSHDLEADEATEAPADNPGTPPARVSPAHGPSEADLETVSALSREGVESLSIGDGDRRAALPKEFGYADTDSIEFPVLPTRDTKAAREKASTPSAPVTFVHRADTDEDVSSILTHDGGENVSTGGETGEPNEIQETTAPTREGLTQGAGRCPPFATEPEDPDSHESWEPKHPDSDEELVDSDEELADTDEELGCPSPFARSGMGATRGNGSKRCRHVDRSDDRDNDDCKPPAAKKQKTSPQQKKPLKTMCPLFRMGKPRAKKQKEPAKANQGSVAKYQKMLSPHPKKPFRMGCHKETGGHKEKKQEVSMKASKPSKSGSQGPTIDLTADAP